MIGFKIRHEFRADIDEWLDSFERRPGIIVKWVRAPSDVSQPVYRPALALHIDPSHEVEFRLTWSEAIDEDA